MLSNLALSPQMAPDGYVCHSSWKCTVETAREERDMSANQSLDVQCTTHIMKLHVAGIQEGSTHRARSRVDFQNLLRVQALVTLAHTEGHWPKSQPGPTWP